MKLEERIYCIEGHWDYGNREVEPSVEPILQMLRGMGHWDHYARRDCATAEECYYFLESEWYRCRPGSVLYFATHGAPGEIWLSENQVVPLEALSAKQIDCSGCLVHLSGCLVHLSGCNVLAEDGEARARKFMDGTGATYVSGYNREAGWADILDAPAAALELSLFSSIKTQSVDLTRGQSKRRMKKLAAELQQSFETCGFELYSKWD